MLFLQVSYTILHIHRKNICLFIFFQFLVVRRGNIFWLSVFSKSFGCAKLAMMERFLFRFCCFGYFKNLRLSKFCSFVFFPLKILSTTSGDRANFIQVLFFFSNLRLSTTSGDGEGTRCGGDRISRRGRIPH